MATSTRGRSTRAFNRSSAKWVVGRANPSSTRSAQETEIAENEGLTIHRQRDIRFFGVFGPITMTSPYLYDRTTRCAARPVRDRLGVVDHGRTRLLERELTDFGAEESFQHAAERFREHYGWSVSRTTAMRVTQRHALAAQAYVQARLRAAEASFDEPLPRRPGVARLLTELDGCLLRTGRLEARNGTDAHARAAASPSRGGVAGGAGRVGRALDAAEPTEPTYVAAMASYPDIVRSLFAAGVARGLSRRTETVAVADGGVGLKEEIEAQFPRVTFILDRPHLQGHLSETAEAMRLQDDARETWRRERVERIDAGRVGEVLGELRRYEGMGADAAIGRVSASVSRVRGLRGVSGARSARRFGRGGKRAPVDSAETSEVAGRVLAAGVHRPDAGVAHCPRQRLVGQLLALENSDVKPRPTVVEHTLEWLPG
ncbi:MAG: hypothetical protein FJY92_12740 [Candidatus Hydrogenedentes bacterium]|nr:hypothetical protein [Candidatus Hydrogenedentota bacterium]